MKDRETNGLDRDTLPFELSALEQYLESLYEEPVQVSDVQHLGAKDDEAQDRLKEFGYGKPLLLVLKRGGTEEQVVLHTVAENGFGHERRSDRAQSMLLDYDTFKALARHVEALDVGAFVPGGHPVSLGRADEFFLLTRYTAGQLYVDDLKRITETGTLAPGDEARAVALADYLADIHAVKRSDPVRYRRRVRDLLGNGEGVMGMLDAYPPDSDLASPSRLARIERRCVTWRWRIKVASHRLSQVHGDFHPWNVLFQEGETFVLLDRSRGAWGEPADDLSAMTINYVFFSLQQHGALEGSFLRLHDLFWRRYLARTGDEEALTVIQPFYAWRGLVLAHPVWYPDLPPGVRGTILDLVERVLDTETFDPYAVNEYLIS